jgi:eukaryotic-like serine/threonine-protein kinase
MALVYKGRHESLGRDAAIKTLLPKDAGDAALRARLLREAQAQAHLKHEHIVTVYDLIEENDELFIAMEYVDGETLAALLDRQPRSRLKLDEALPLFEQVLDALAYVHDEKIVHRDVKPSNVMVCGNRVKLADFGIALLTESPRITASLQLIGSPPYMSPEQLEGKGVDSRSDIYSAALVLYRMLAGRAAFEAKEYFAQIQERFAGPVDLRTLVPELPAGVCDAIAIALRHGRDERFRSVGAFRDALREGAVGFFVSAPQAIEDDVLPNADEVPTERLPLAAATTTEPPPPWRAMTLAAVVTAGTLAAAIAVIRKQPDRQSFPVNAPAQKSAVASAIPQSVILEMPVPRTEPPKVEPPKPNPFPSPATTRSEAVEDTEAKRRNELEALRDAIRRGLAHAQEELGVAHFDGAIEELDRVAEMAQRRPGDLRDERAEIAELRARVVEKRVAAEQERAEAAQWASRLADIEEDLRAEHWPEAERFANGIAKDPHAPEAIVARARALLERAKEGRRNAFKDTQVGPTNNTIRKPSSPPRNEI